MSGDTTPIPHQPSRPPNPTPNQSEIESSPIYQALSLRLMRTENALSTLSTQVSQLTSFIQTLPNIQNGSQSHSQMINTSPTRSKNTINHSSSSVFTPFDDELPLPSNLGIGGLGSKSQNGSIIPKSPFIPTSTTQPQSQTPSSNSNSNSNAHNHEIAALTQQISALSTSVAQLQRLQQSQNSNNIIRQNSSNQTSTLSNLGIGNIGGERIKTQNQNQNQNQNQHQQNHLALGIPRPLHQGVESLINSNGPMTTPNQSFGSPSSGINSTPIPGGGGGGGGVGGGGIRPNMNRSFSSGVIGQPSSQHPNPNPNQGHNQGHTPSGLRDWQSQSQSPGPGSISIPMQTPDIIRTTNNGPLTPGGNSIAPGAGIVITKWDHLNLKVDLLRSISKYGIGPPNKIQTRVLPFMIKGNDIIAQAPPTTERIISYVIPALHLVQGLPPPTSTYNGPAVIIITTTVDQAMQCHKLVRGVGGPLGIRSGVAAGAAGSSGMQNEIAAMQRDAIHILIGTPAKIAEVMSSRGGLAGGECRLLILDEVDQLIARNLYDNVLNVAKLLPAPRRGNGGGASMTGPLTPGGAGPIGTPFSPGLTSPYDAGRDSPFNPASKTPFPSQGSRFGTSASNVTSNTNGAQGAGSTVIERQTCLFSNTIPTDVINFSQSLSVRDPVRVLVRREGGTNSQESVSSVTPGINLKHTYVYLTITGSAQAGNPQQVAEIGPGTIGSGRNQGGQNEEQTRAKEYKLDTLIKMLEDYPLWQAVIHVGTFSTLEAVVFRLQNRKWETLYLTPDMPPSQKKAILQQWRISLSGNGPRFLVVFDVNIKPPEVPWSPLVINFDLPRSVEGYAHRAAAAVPPSTRQGAQVNGVVVSFVQAAGGDVEMLRSTECAYRFKSAEIPTVFHDLFNH
ncbi:uncharacterized protein IL334_004395 [Kwoniella shivajii]|uniref:RNA helicase n=1 Tax=Kwoniella shivajii TaxID=564305 RepID=A0ABZ1D1K3_9TREE|nr:hypothetical protein IL334_004395 [Kwoniella shivajii]